MGNDNSSPVKQEIIRGDMKNTGTTLITLQEAAEMLSLHPETLRRWDNNGKLLAIKVNERGDRKYRKEDIERLIAAGNSRRDERGRFVEGISGNPNGRPKKGFTLTDIAKEILEEELPSGITRKEALMRKIATLAYEGNETMIKLMWNYVDGMPTQRQEIGGTDGESFELVIKDYRGDKPTTQTK